MSEIKKVVRNGKVAVIYSPGYGAGWLTWGAPLEMIYDPELVALIEKHKQKDIEPLLIRRGFSFYMGGAIELEIEWVPQGTAFMITEYDGSESIEYKENDNWIIA